MYMFISKGLNILDIINVLRDKDDDQLDIQCDVFYDELDEDDAEKAEVSVGYGRTKTLLLSRRSVIIQCY